MLVVVICEPIAAGKSTLSRSLAARLEAEQGISASVVDLDLVYEMLDARPGPKDDERVWSDARRIAGRLAGLLLHESRSVIAEGGDFATDAALAEFENELPEDAEVRLVLLEVDLDTAFRRASGDDSRRISKDRAFLSAHRAEFGAEWSGRSVLQLDTAAASPSETARAVVDWLRLGQYEDA